MRTNLIIILTTCGSRKEAKKIAKSLLEKKLVACANIISRIESKFWWKDKIDKAKEVLIILKTRNGNFKRIEKEIKCIHSYEVPEIIALPIVAGNKIYLDWLRKEAIR